MHITYYFDNKKYEVDGNDSNIEIRYEYIDKRVVVKLVCKRKIKLISCEDVISHNYYKDDLFFLNGYQSWTDSYEYKYNEKLKNIYKLPKWLVDMFSFDKYGDQTFVEYSKDVFHAFDISYVKGRNPICIINYNYKNAYLIIRHNKKQNLLILHSDVSNKLLDENEEYTIFNYVIDSNISNTINELKKQFKCNNKKLFGYTSWYNHYQNINESIILNDMPNDSRFNLFQIDDGFEEYVGDWLKIDKNKFPNGLKPVVDKIHNKNMLAGIWLAPFICEEKSYIFKEHKDWIKKDSIGNLVKAGCNWSGFYALDIFNLEVVDYIKNVLNYYVSLGFDFFKLDFLYACNLENNSNMTRAEVSEYAYSLLRECLKDKLILGCGATIFNSIDKFDYLRIGPDVSLKFDDVWYMKYMHRERISTKNTLRNTIYRSIFNGLFLNDPDVFLLRDNNIWLNKKQRYALTIINSLFGSLLMTSDDINNYDDEKRNILKVALDNFYNGIILNYQRIDNKIRITYKIKDVNKTFSYDIKKGVITNG